MIAGDLAIKIGDLRSNAKRILIIYGKLLAMESKAGRLKGSPPAST
jgi:hypothetical protein